MIISRFICAVCSYKANNKGIRVFLDLCRHNIERKLAATETNSFSEPMLLLSSLNH